MSRIYLADKQTLDTVNTKVGVSSDTESATPTTLFAGVKNIIKGITELKKSVSDGKTKVANAITGKGITTATNAAFTTMANNINTITTLAQGTNDANATAAQILSGRTAYVKGSKITGTIPSKGAAIITPGTANQTIGAGQYLSGVQTIAGSANLVPGNIKQGVNLFGVMGNIDVSMLNPSNYRCCMTCGNSGYGTDYINVTECNFTAPSGYMGAKFTFNYAPKIIMIESSHGSPRIIIPGFIILYYYRTNASGNESMVISTPQLNYKYADIDYDDKVKYFMMSDNYSTFEFCKNKYDKFYVRAWG